jgi:hypothetical protein
VAEMSFAGVAGLLGFSKGGNGSGLTLPLSWAAEKFAANSESASATLVVNARLPVCGFRRAVCIGECELCRCRRRYDAIGFFSRRKGRAVSPQIVETSSQAIDNSPQYISRPGLTLPT